VTNRNLPDDLPARLRKAGLKVVEIDGWRERGRPASTGSFAPVGVLNHHTGSHDPIGDFADDLSYAKWLFRTGRADLPAPLCGLSISAEGTVYVGAAGRSNHAGIAKASGSVAQGDGNSLYVGIEWMLSGSQVIPDKMYEAGVKTNGVLLDWMDNSVQTISCHYQTSVTGKWDIGDPNGIPFNGHKVLNVPKFRDAVKRWRNSRHAAPKPDDFDLLRLMHASMQFGDPTPQQSSDVERIFERAVKREVAWITGTESGPGSDDLPDLLLNIGKEAGYLLYVPNAQEKRTGSSTDGWIAVRKDLITGGWERGFDPVIPGSTQLYDAQGLPKPGDIFPRWGPKGVIWVSFNTERLGRIGVSTAHYLTKGRRPNHPIRGVDHFEWNRRLATAIGERATEQGDGKNLAFYGGDQNIVDRDEDTFFGSPLTSAWDEVDRYENTGHGNIDVIASFDKDGRVEAQGIRALDDKEFPLNTDHFLTEAEYRVRHLG
jgi:hypothetical protein